MNIQYISDIHLEFLNMNEYNKLINKLKPLAHVCILAGDIGNPYKQNYKDFLGFINTTFKKTFLIAGNHEYYTNNINETKTHIKNIVSEFENISFLDNSYEEYEGYRFIGTTQWTEIKNPIYTINDINYINNFSIDDYNKLFYEARNFLETSIVPNSIIISHHLPIHELTHIKYRNSMLGKYNQWFNANLDELIKNNTQHIKAWFYGHTHSRSVQTHYDIHFYCNPLGYPNENTYETLNISCNI